MIEVKITILLGFLSILMNIGYSQTTQKKVEETFQFADKIMPENPDTSLILFRQIIDDASKLKLKKIGRAHV